MKKVKDLIEPEPGESKAHERAESPSFEKGEDKSKGKIMSMHIETMDDGTYGLTSHTDKGHMQKTTHPHVAHLLSHIKDNLVSPHLPKLGTGKRFDLLKNKLSNRSDVTDPGKLAAWIGNRKYGSAKMHKMAAANR